MGLQKDIVYGDETLSYHRVYRTNGYCTDEKTCFIHLLGYSDKASRDAGDSAKRITMYPVDAELFDTYFSDSVLKQADKSLVSQAYVYLKTLPEWSGAVDC